MQNYDVTLMNSAKQRHVIAQFWFEKVLNILINNPAKFVKILSFCEDIQML